MNPEVKLEEIYYDSRLWLFETNEGVVLGFNEIPLNDFMFWANFFPSVKECDLESAKQLFEQWVKAPFSNK